MSHSWASDGDGDLDTGDVSYGPADYGNGVVSNSVLLLNDGSGNFTQTPDLLPD